LRNLKPKLRLLARFTSSKQSPGVIDASARSRQHVTSVVSTPVVYFQLRFFAFVRAMYSGRTWPTSFGERARSCSRCAPRQDRRRAPDRD
jgi:hypothetical protein